jgi:rod shape-determining protein MreC
MLKRHLIIVVVAVVCVFIFLNLPSRFSSGVRVAVVQAVSPLVKIERAFFDFFANVRGVWDTRRSLKRENLLLKKKVKSLSSELFSLRALKNENERFRRLLAFKNSSAYALMPAQIIGRDTIHWYSSVIIDKGLADGVSPGMAVLCEEGLVGRVIEAGASTSKILLIVDRRSRVGGMIERTREMGIVEGTSFNTCRLDYMPRQSQARPGDEVITSGLGEIYPKGLHIGKIAKVNEDEYGFYKYADVLPGVDFAKLEEVLVLVQER